MDKSKFINPDRFEISLNKFINMEFTSFVDYEWNLDNVKVRDGRYGPICSGLNLSSYQLMNAEVIEQGRDPQTAQILISHLNEHLRHRTSPTEPHPSIVTFLGFSQKEEGLCLLWDWESQTLQDCIQEDGATTIDVVTVGIYLGQLAHGIEALQQRGFPMSFLSSAHIMLGINMRAKIVPPVIDMAAASFAALPPGLLTVPELILDGPLPSNNLPKVDVWLLGIVGAELLTGKCLTDTSARQIRAQLQERESGDDGSAWEFFVPRSVVENLDTHAVYFFRQCFML